MDAKCVAMVLKDERFMKNRSKALTPAQAAHQVIFGKKRSEGRGGGYLQSGNRLY